MTGVAAPPRFEELHTPRLVLRRFRQDDLPVLVAYRNDPELARYQSWSVLSENQARAWISDEGNGEPAMPGRGFHFAVAHRERDELLGDVYFSRLWHEQRQAEIGYTFARNEHGHGYASEAVAAVLGYAFDTLALHRVAAWTATLNTRSIALLERLQMRREGTTLRSFWRDGQWLDEHLYAMLRDEWLRRGDG